METQNTITRSQMDNFFGSQEKVQNLVNELNEDLKELHAQDEMKAVMICSHNTILAITIDGEVTHIVDTDEESNLIHIGRVDKYLSVSRYEPKVAKAWLKEETQFHNSFLTDEEIAETKYGKILLSERELRAIIIKQRETALKSQEHILEIYKGLVA